MPISVEKNTDPAESRSARLLYLRKMTLHRPEFRWIVPLVFFIGLLAPLLISSWYTLRLQADNVEAGLQFEYDRMADVLANGMQKPVWNLLPEIGQPLVDSMMADPRVLEVDVTTTEGNRFISASRDAPPIKPITLTRDLTFNATPIGTVTLVIESSETDNILKEQSTRVYIATAVQSVVSFFIVMMMYLLITRFQDKQTLQRINTELETQVKERTREFQVATEEAQVANLAKSEFLSSMSHELRTPMNSVLGFAQLLSDDPVHPLTKKQQQFVEKILKNGEVLMDLINQVLDLAKIEEGRVDLDHSKISISDIMSECGELVQPLLGQYNVDLNADPSGYSDAHVWADEKLLRQIFLNLLSNAIKYNQNGGAVSIICEHTSATTIRVNVADTGIGVPEDLRENLFEPFNRLTQQNSPIEGTGIGLVIAQKLAEHMNGSIGYSPRPTGGSLFWVELPVAKGD